MKTNQDTAGWNAGVTQNMSKFGGNYQVNWTNNRQVTTQTTAQFLTAYTTGFQAQFTQPLLANFKIDNTRTTLLTTAIQQDQAELDLQATTASTVAQVRNAYWELVFAILNLENQRASLDLSSKLVQDNRARVEIGTMAPIDIVQAQAEEATRRQTLVNAEATLQNTELDAQATHRERDRRPAVDGDAQRDRPSRRRAPRRSTSRAPCATRWPTGPTS